MVAVVAVFLAMFDFKGYAERRASADLGRPVTIRALDLRIFPLEAIFQDINVADVALGQPVPDKKPPFMKAGHVDAVVGFWRLIAGDIALRYLSVEDAVIRIERKPDGTMTWEVDRPGSDHAAPALPEIADLRLRDVKLLYTDTANKAKLTLNLATREYDDGREPSLIIKGAGTYQGQPSTITATGGSLTALRDAENPYPIDGTLVSGATSISVKGTVTDPAHITGLNVTLNVKGQDAADLYRVAGIALPPTPPYVIDTHLDRVGARWIFKNLKWTLGKATCPASWSGTRAIRPRCLPEICAPWRWTWTISAALSAPRRVTPKRPSRSNARPPHGSARNVLRPPSQSRPWPPSS